MTIDVFVNRTIQIYSIFLVTLSLKVVRGMGQLIWCIKVFQLKKHVSYLPVQESLIQDVLETTKVGKRIIKISQVNQLTRRMQLSSIKKLDKFPNIQNFLAERLNHFIAGSIDRILSEWENLHPIKGTNKGSHNARRFILVLCSNWTKTTMF